MENGTLPELRRMSRLLALVAVKGLEAGAAAHLLDRAGYTHTEVGKLLGLSANAVEIRLRRTRQRSTPRRPKAKGKRK